MNDLISRQAAIDAECEACQIAPKKERGHNCTYYVHGCKEIECLRALPSAQPERKKGKWVEVAVTDGYDKDGIKTWISVMQCDQCGFIVNAIEGHTGQYNFCPNCGADMRRES